MIEEYRWCEHRLATTVIFVTVCTYLAADRIDTALSLRSRLRLWQSEKTECINAFPTVTGTPGFASADTEPVTDHNRNATEYRLT